MVGKNLGTSSKRLLMVWLLRFVVSHNPNSFLMPWCPWFVFFGKTWVLFETWRISYWVFFITRWKQASKQKCNKSHTPPRWLCFLLKEIIIGEVLFVQTIYVWNEARKCRPYNHAGMQYTKYDVLFFGLYMNRSVTTTRTTGSSIHIRHRVKYTIVSSTWRQESLDHYSLTERNLWTELQAFSVRKDFAIIPAYRKLWNFMKFTGIPDSFFRKFNPSMIESCSHHQGSPFHHLRLELQIQNVSPTVRRLVKSFNSGTGKTCSSRSSRPSECMLPCMAHLELEKDGLRISCHKFILRLKMFNEEKVVWGCWGWVWNLNAFWR